MEQNQQLLEQIQQKFLLKQMPAKEYSPLVLAYIGDGIYDMIVRTIFVSYGNTQVDKLMSAVPLHRPRLHLQLHRF